MMRVQHVACVQDVTAIALWHAATSNPQQHDHRATTEPLLLLGKTAIVFYVLYTSSMRTSNGHIAPREHLASPSACLTVPLCVAFVHLTAPQPNLGCGSFVRIYGATTGRLKHSQRLLPHAARVHGLVLHDPYAPAQAMVLAYGDRSAQVVC